MKAFEAGFTLGFAHKSDSEFSEVNGFDPEKRDQKDGKESDSGTVPVKVGLQRLAN